MMMMMIIMMIIMINFVMVIDWQTRIAPNTIYNYWQPHSIQLGPYHTEKEGVAVFAFLFKTKCPTAKLLSNNIGRQQYQYVRLSYDKILKC